ncbi:uncharacterized protein [Mytilus edulis]|uniref:uncharacterized protein isoform X1 n=2 Tax=Mytilus edulis TaxID=6550 RepID=UPI0039EF50B3
MSKAKDIPRKEKMRTKKPEWLEQYQEVSRKQQEYLSKVQNLRQSIQNKDEHVVMVSVERERHLKGRRSDRRHPTMNKMKQTVITFRPKPFPSRPIQDRRLQLVPHSIPRKLPPIIKPSLLHVDLTSGFRRTDTTVIPVELEQAHTDLEAIEAIAERNKIDLKGMLRVQSPPSKRRQELSVSKVCLKDITPEIVAPLFKTPLPDMEYITNLSSRKEIVATEKSK